MVNLSVCIEMFWRDLSPEQKIQKAAGLGFKHVEFWSWSNKNLDSLAKSAKKNKLSIGAFCFEAAKRLVEPNAEEALVKGLEDSIAAAKKLKVKSLIITTGNERKAESFEVTRRTVVRNLKALLPTLEKNGMTLCIEPLNPIVDHVGYWLNKMSDAADICYEIDSPNVKILMDIYHQQLTEGNIIANLRQYAPLIGHFHTAGAPGRHELAGGDLDYASIFRAIEDTGYKNLIGLEFSPLNDTAAALREAQELAAKAAK
ncbi:MAG: hypothetical protein A2X49_10095 [Lentisphaerae bacterium GWF2_52_8]|nr:MAG: hypothetical protein A2X49_10095 [Lentisphaerae bacterium GWF2_52_8]